MKLHTIAHIAGTFAACIVSANTTLTHRSIVRGTKYHCASLFVLDYTVSREPVYLGPATSGRIRKALVMGERLARVEGKPLRVGHKPPVSPKYDRNYTGPIDTREHATLQNA